MTNESLFEEILNQEFRWPEPGDDPFAIPNGTTDATIAENNFLRFGLMQEGYQRAAKCLVDRALKDNDWHEADCLIYPILFLYRHCLELELKYIINIYGRYVGIAPVWNTHDLTRLWREFKNVIDKFRADDAIDDTDGVVEKIVAQFSKIDPASSSHRYPCNNKGDPLPIIQDKLSLKTLKDVMDRAFGYFDGWHGYLDDLASAGP